MDIHVMLQLADARIDETVTAPVFVQCGGHLVIEMEVTILTVTDWCKNASLRRFDSTQKENSSIDPGSDDKPNRKRNGDVADRT